MAQQPVIPEEFESSFRRILPYLSASLQNDPKVMESLVLYFKLGGEKMARIVVDALNVTHRMQYAEMLKKMREEAMLHDKQGEEDASDDEEDDEEEGGEDAKDDQSDDA